MIGTLYKHLDYCRTTSGKRLLRRWICHPLKEIDDINDRLNVVEGLINNPEVISIMSQYLCKLPDLDRLLGRVKAFVGSSYVLLLPLIGAKMLKQQVCLRAYVIGSILFQYHYSHSSYIL